LTSENANDVFAAAAGHGKTGIIDTTRSDEAQGFSGRETEAEQEATVG